VSYGVSRLSQANRREPLKIAEKGLNEFPARLAGAGFAARWVRLTGVNYLPCRPIARLVVMT